MKNVSDVIEKVERNINVEGRPDNEKAIMRLIINDLEKLDEPEVLSQEWIDENKHYYPVTAFNNSAKRIVDVEDLQNILVPKQEKVKIPKFVAEWYESEGKLRSWWNWFYKWGRDDDGDDLEVNIIDWMQDYNEEKFVDVFRYGYEVEKEQKYYVLDKEDATLLKKTERGGVAKSVGTNIYNVKSWKDEEKYQLTKREIKEYDERYMMFTVRIEEFEK